MIDGHTKLVGLLGWPVEHSLSPAMHNAAFESLGLNWRYVPLAVRPGQVEAAVRGLGALGFLGANVTVPHKQAALGAVDVADAGARALGAVNTLVIDRGQDGRTTVSGYNTDARGFIFALHAGGYDPASGGRAVVVGAGGAARAVVHGLLSEGTGKVDLLNRTLSRAKDLVRDVGATAEGSGRLRALPLTRETLVESSRGANLLVNATTVGMWPDMGGSIWPADLPLPLGLTVFDLVYNPLETTLLRQARASARLGVDGLEMLVQQGALAFCMWTRQQYDIGRVATTMRDACRKRVQANARLRQA